MLRNNKTKRKGIAAVEYLLLGGIMTGGVIAGGNAIKDQYVTECQEFSKDIHEISQTSRNRYYQTLKPNQPVQVPQKELFSTP